MKNAVKVLVFLFLLSACSDQGRDDKVEKTAGEQPVPEHHHHEQDANTLSLNNGKKWKSDESTVRNVKLLEQMIARFGGKEGPNLSDYQRAAAELQSGLDMMVRECRMKGDDHAALHKWLEPLMQQVNELQSSKSTLDASAKFIEIESQVGIFHKFFE